MILISQVRCTALYDVSFLVGNSLRLLGWVFFFVVLFIHEGWAQERRNG